MRSRRIGKTVVATGLATTVAAAGFGLGQYLGDEESESTRPAAAADLEPGQRQGSVTVGNGLALLPSDSVDDWTAYASAVAVITVTAEHAHPIPESDEKHGEGMIDRTVDVHLDDVLWARSGKTPPDTISVDVPGWVWKDRPEAKSEFAMHGQPRFEVGQQYLVAIVQYPGVTLEVAERCDEASLASQPRWGTLGDTGAIPITDGVIGPGEHQGSIRSLEQAKQEAATAQTTGHVAFRDGLIGQTLDDVRAVLEDAAARTAPKEVPSLTC